MRKQLRRFLVALVVGVAVLLPPFVTQAAEKPYVALDSSTGVSGVLDAVNTKSKELGNFRFFSTETSGTQLKVKLDKAGYLALKSDDKRELMAEALGIIQDSGMPKKEQNRLYNFVAEQDEATSSLVRELSEEVNGDYVSALRWFKPFSGGISTLLGFMAILITVLLSVAILVDTAYIALSPFRVALDNTDGSKPKIISNEAFMSVRDSERDANTYRNAMWLYVKRRVGMMVAIGLCLGYLLSGQIYMIIGWFIDVISSVI